ncbi:MAG: hypothetical protein QOH56_4509 [Pseudonocardiales bacterium]|nr:hypothetical protein [Pseudonocardiales bacterium]
MIALKISGSSVAIGESSTATTTGDRPSAGPAHPRLADEQLRCREDGRQRDECLRSRTQSPHTACTAEATLPHNSFGETDIAGCRLTVIRRPRMLNGETRVVATGCHDGRR